MSYFDAAELRKLSLDLGDEPRRVGQRVADAIRESSAAVQRRAQVTAPKVTGTLRDSITVDLRGDGRSAGLTAVIGPEAYYGVFVENGTARMAPKPFMQPALDAEAPVLEQAIADIVGEALS